MNHGVIVYVGNGTIEVSIKGLDEAARDDEQLRTRLNDAVRVLYHQMYEILTWLKISVQFAPVNPDAKPISFEHPIMDGFENSVVIAVTWNPGADIDRERAYELLTSILANDSVWRALSGIPAEIDMHLDEPLFTPQAVLSAAIAMATSAAVGASLTLLAQAVIHWRRRRHT